MLKQNNTSNFLLKNMILISIGFFISAGLFLFYRKFILNEEYFTFTIFALAGILFHYSKSQKRLEFPISKIIFGILLFAITYICYYLYKAYEYIPQWDYLCFYIFGNVGISTSDFYNPVIFSKFYEELHLQSITNSLFIQEIVEVGFWYPPPSMFLFLPLGLFDLKTGHIVWQTMITSFFLIDIFLLLRWYSDQTIKKENGITEFPILLIILLFPNILASFFYSQIISIFLFFLILTIKNINNWKSGIYLTILVFIKPLAAIFMLYYLLFKKWKVIASAAIAFTIILILTTLLFGYDPLLNYIVSPPTDRIPDYIYFEASSLLGVLRNLHLNFLSELSINGIKMLYYLLSICLIILAFYASKQLSKVSTPMAFMIFIPLALMVYPVTYFNYCTLLLPVVIYIFYQVPFRNYSLKLVLVFCLYVIGHYHLFLLNLTIFGILTIWSLLLKYSKTKLLDASFINLKQII